MDLSFEQLVRGELCYSDSLIWLRPKKFDIGGGRIEKDDIDLLASHPDSLAVRITGLRQDTFEYFIQTYGRQLKAIDFFKNKLVEDWSLLGSLPELEYVHWFANQRINKFWDMSNNFSLRGLCISDFSRLHSIEGIGRAPALKYFSFQDAIWDSSEVESFSPLTNTGITHLCFGGKRITDNSLDFLEGMPNLEVFDFALNKFSTEQVAWIVANFPSLRGFALRAKRDDTVCRITPNGEYVNVPGAFITGKRKPALAYEENADRIQKYVDNFEALKHKYKGMSYKDAFGE